MNDLKLFKWLGLLILLPIALAYFSGDRFRYPCQNPDNWETPQCQKPRCDVTRTCPEHVFKGQRDPRLGPPEEPQNTLAKQQLGKPQPEVKCNVK
jgi:hypothetical protein